MNKYRGENGVYLTKGLFYEWNNPEAEYSMRDTGQEEYYVNREGEKYLSLPYIFRNCETEYECAIKVLGSWAHWKKLKACKWFETGMINGIQYTGLKDWVLEKELADETAAKKVLMEAVEEGNLQAAKFIYDKKATVAPKGRPTKSVPEVKKSSVLSLARNIKAS